MRKVFLFMMISLDGFFEGVNHDLSWHNIGATQDEFNEFAIAQLHEIDTIIFGERTYQMMKDYWPTEAALKDDPIVASLMNSTSKIVFSKTIESVDWNNSKLYRDISELKKIKEEGSPQSGVKKDMAIFGSNNLTVSLIEAGLVDEFRIMINPVAIGEGYTLFTGISSKLDLNLIKTKQFTNGNVLLYYQPAK